ncbi:SDR family oxidoreductase [Streptomyces sp. LRE541]|uniref:SDR family oxidoreductase n=1 Tax=Streptomyces sp. LRE541 TaxID=2931983 RepID=UPI002010303E|nr:SDR family oxidoreductase [Streptomyces sp. LRE541]UPZ26528.1 SDR family oxidoreductase [Streptomyces sp. LRE541]
MAKHVVIGAGSIGTNVARLLAERGESIRIVTRSGSGPEHPLIDRVAADASDPTRLTELSRGAEVIYHCANPPSYTVWERLLPPLQTAAITAAKANDAVLALTGSLYAYGPQPDGRMNEHTPMAATGHKGRLRRRMWEQALAGRIRTVEVRGSDYIGKDANGIYSLLIKSALQKGKAAWITGHLDMPHTFTFNGDMAQALITLASEERAWGRSWHVPSPPAVTIRELARHYAVAAGRPPVKLIRIPRSVTRTAGLIVPIAREMAEMDYQWYAPFHMDATETADTFGLTATDLDTAVRNEVS